jgi:hypothetical protein
MPPQLMFQGLNIVIRGKFNPTILQPQWLAAQELIRPAEAEAANIEIIHPQVAAFTAEWLGINVTLDRFQASTSQEPYYEFLCDLVAGLFGILRYTPLEVIGINRDFHYRLESQEKWHKVGDALAPKEPWGELLSNPGMKVMGMQGQRPDGYQGYIMVQVEPSIRTDNGVYVTVNDHYQLESAKESPKSAEEATQILMSQWKESMERGLRIA